MTAPADVASRCPHLPDGERDSFTQQAPPGVRLVRCPCCGLSGWCDDDDPEPMVCPYCAEAAVERDETSL